VYDLNIKVVGARSLMRKIASLSAEIQDDAHDAVEQHAIRVVESAKSIIRGESPGDGGAMFSSASEPHRTGVLEAEMNYEMIGPAVAEIYDNATSPRGFNYAYLQHEGGTRVSGKGYIAKPNRELFPEFLADLNIRKESWDL